MKIAVFADVHGNLPALESVMEAIKQKNVDFVVCCGDLVGYGTFPNEVIELLQDEKVLCVNGNYDDAVAYRRMVCGCNFPNEKEAELGIASLQWSMEHLQDEKGQWLKELPDQVTFKDFEKYSIAFFHGSYRSLTEYIKIDHPISFFEELAKDAPADILVFGHTHIPFHKVVEGIHFINVGSVGKPKDGDLRACFALIDIDETDVKVVFHRAEYDVEKIVTGIENSEMPNEFARRIKRAR